jgi:hypothetical protein
MGMGHRLKEPGWVRIGLYDRSERRSLWLRYTPKIIELCSGREGDDQYVKITDDNPAFVALEGVLSHMRYAREMLVDALASDVIFELDQNRVKYDHARLASDLARDVQREVACRTSPLHEHEHTDYITLEICPFDPTRES